MLRADRRTRREEGTAMVNAKALRLGFKKIFGNEAQCAAKSMSNCDPQTLQNLAWNVPRPSKIEVLEVPGSLNSRKRRPRPAKRCPRSTQEGPRAAQECPKAGQVVPKSCPRRPQTLPKPSAVTSKTSFQHNLCWQLCAKGSRSDFVSFFCSCDKLAICKKPRKT